MTVKLADGWVVSRLGQLVSIASGQTPKDLERHATKDGSVPWFRVGDMNTIGNERELRHAHVRLSATAVKTLGLHVRPAGTLVFPKRGGAIATNKKRLLAQPSAYDLNTMGLLVADDLRDYLWWWFQTVDLGRLNTGTAVPQINNGDIEPLEVPLAPAEERPKIVAKIEALTQKSRRAKEALDAIPPLLERFRQSVLASAFRGDLTKDWRAKHPDVESIEDVLARIVVNASKTGREATINTIHGRAALAVGMPDVAAPDGWKWMPLCTVARLESGHTPSRKHPEWWGGEVPWIGIKDAGEYHGATILQTQQTTNEKGLANSAARLLPAGTVCLSRTASVGYVVVMGRPMATSQDFANWVCSAAIEPDFLMYALLAEGDHLRKFGKGSTHTTIYFPELKAFHVCLPPVDEQREIVRVVRNRLEMIERFASSIELAGNQAKSLDASILAKAFRGELTTGPAHD